MNTQSRAINLSLYVRDPISALTHFIGLVAAACAAPVLVQHGIVAGLDPVSVMSLVVFMVSMMALYAASTAYHTAFRPEYTGKGLKKLDHMMIFILIAGSYTPVCAIGLHSSLGYTLLAIVWAVAVLGILFKAFWVTCPRWVSSVIYIGMGWLCIMAFPEILQSISMTAFLWLLIGGIFYTVGGVVYALKLPLLERAIPGFGAHELFHVFVMAGSFCQYISVFKLI